MKRDALQKSKLWQLIRAMDEHERIRCMKFLRSPYFNQREDVVQLFEYLVESQNPVPEAAYAQLFPGTSFEAQALRYVMSYLYRLLEQFLSTEILAGSPFRSKMLLLQALQEKSQDKPLRHTLNAVARTLDDKVQRNQRFYFQQYELNQLLFSAAGGRKKEAIGALQGVSEALDHFFILRKLQLGLSMLTHQRLFKVDYDPGLLDPVIRYVEEQGLNADPVIAVHYYGYRILSGGAGDGDFRLLREAIQLAAPQLDDEELKSFYLLAINYGIQQLNLGITGFSKAVLELYQEALTGELLFENGELRPYTYKNIAAAGLKTGDYAWVETFIRGYQEKVPAEERESYYRYNMANLYLATGRFRDVVETVARVYVDDLFTNLDIKVMLIKAYFELGEYQYIEYLLDNFKQLLRRKEVMTYHRENYSNFTRFTIRLINLAPKDRPGRKKLKEEIGASGVLTEKKWLLEKLQDLS